VTELRGNTATPIEGSVLRSSPLSFTHGCGPQLLEQIVVGAPDSRLQQQLPIIHDHIGASLPHAANGRFEARVLV
jgi:hypothetical protein